MTENTEVFKCFNIDTKESWINISLRLLTKEKQDILEKFLSSEKVEYEIWEDF